MAMTLAGVGLVLGLAAFSPQAGPADASVTRRAPASLSQLAWIAGHWVDDSGGDVSEEIWAAPAGDSMIGMWRYVARGKLQIFELLSITAEDGGPVFRLRHFDPRMTAREEKASPLTLKLVSIGEGEAAFEGPGQPSGTVRLTYRRQAPDSLSVTLDKDGKPQTFRFRRHTTR